MYSVSIKNISKKFGKTEVLKDISLEIKSGELFFLLGPSGCGKTTLLRILAGFEQPESGTVLFNGSDMTRVPPQKRNTSMVFQNYALWPHMRVAENIAFGLENLKLSKTEISARVDKILELVRMRPQQARQPNQLSGGQQQRVALARALVVNPQLLLLDEPLSNLDARLRAEMRVELLRLHRKTGVTTVYVTHDQDEALSMADRIGYMDNGALAQVGSPRELYLQPATIAAAQFIGSATIVPGEVQEVKLDTVFVKTAFGILRGRARPAHAAGTGQKVSVFFRPDALQLVRTEQESSISAKVVSVLYRGANEQLMCENNDVGFEATIPAPQEPTAIGSDVRFLLQEKDVLILTH